MFAFEDGVDGRAESDGHAVFASSQDGGPGGVEQDVADAGFAVQQDGDAALEGLDGGDAVALNGGHEEKMRLREEMLEVLVGDEAVKVDAVADAEVLRHCLKCGDEGAAAGEVESPVDAGGERRFGLFEFGEGADDPVDAFVGFDAADGEHAELLFDGTDGGLEDAGPESAHADDLCFDVEVPATFAAEVFAGDDGAAAGAQTVSDDAVGDGDAEFCFGASGVLVAEE